MSTRTDLTETQQKLLDAATAHPEGRLVFPDTLRGGARQKVINALAAEDLIEADAEGWCLTEQGYNAMGFAPPESESDEPLPLDDTVPTVEAPPAPKPVKTRADSKQATVIRMLQRPEGATLDQLVAETHWQKHSVRGALSMIGKKLGLTITSAKEPGGDRIYRAA